MPDTIVRIFPLFVMSFGIGVFLGVFIGSRSTAQAYQKLLDTLVARLEEKRHA